MVNPNFYTMRANKCIFGKNWHFTPEKELPDLITRFKRLKACIIS